MISRLIESEKLAPQNSQITDLRSLQLLFVRKHNANLVRQADSSVFII